MSAWSSTLTRLEGLLSRAEACLEAGDLDGASVALRELDDPRLRSAGGATSPAEAERAMYVAERLSSTASAVRDAMARLRPELDLLAGASVAERTTSRYLDQPL